MLRGDECPRRHNAASLDKRSAPSSTTRARGSDSSRNSSTRTGLPSLPSPSSAIRAPKVPTIDGRRLKNVGDVARKMVEEHLDRASSSPAINHGSIQLECEGPVEFADLRQGPKRCRQRLMPATLMLAAHREVRASDNRFPCQAARRHRLDGPSAARHFSRYHLYASFGCRLIAGADGGPSAEPRGSNTSRSIGPDNHKMRLTCKARGPLRDPTLQLRQAEPRRVDPRAAQLREHTANKGYLEDRRPELSRRPYQMPSRS